MIFNALNGKSKSVTSAAILIAVMSLISRIIGLFRDRILAGTFGASDILDAYYSAFRIPDFIFSLLVVGAISASFIPIFVKHYGGESDASEARAWRFTNLVLNLMLIVFVVLSLFGFIFSEQLSAFVSPGFSPQKQQMVAEFMRVMLLASTLLAISNVFGSALQGLKRFFFYAAAPILYNLGIIFGALALVPIFGPIGLGWGVAIGALFHVAIQYFGLRGVGYRYGFELDIKDPEIKSAAKITFPRMISLGISQINFIVMTALASTLANGSVSIFQFAYNLEFFAVGIIGVSYAIAAFPTLSEHAAKSDIENFVKDFSSGARNILFLIVPTSIIFLLLRAQIVRLVLGSGLFGWEETILTADTLAFFALSFFAQSLIYILTRSYFAFRDSVTPLLAAIISAAINVLAAMLFIKDFGVVGLGMAFSLSAIVQFSMLWILLRVRLGSLGEAGIIKSMQIISVAGILSGLSIQIMKGVVVMVVSLDTFFGVLAQGFIAGLTGLIVYLVASGFMQSPELAEILGAMKKKFLKKAVTSESVEATL